MVPTKLCWDTPSATKNTSVDNMTTKKPRSFLRGFLVVLRGFLVVRTYSLKVYLIGIVDGVVQSTTFFAFHCHLNH